MLGVSLIECWLRQRMTEGEGDHFCNVWGVHVHHYSPDCRKRHLRRYVVANKHTTDCVRKPIQTWAIGGWTSGKSFYADHVVADVNELWRKTSGTPVVVIQSCVNARELASLAYEWGISYLETTSYCRSKPLIQFRLVRFYSVYLSHVSLLLH